MDDYYGWREYVPVGVRRRQAMREVAKRAKNGQQASPVVIDGRKIATTFWGKAWCDNLERYSDFANRLPRGRTYVRNGSVVDLQIAPGAVRALVSGSDLYEVDVKVTAVSKPRWSAVCQDCAGAIDSLVELLQGRFSTAVMARLCHEKTGLFPEPADIEFTCSCPDWASMCKHVAAVLYGIGARLDAQPDLLFALRKVNQTDLIAKAGEGLSQKRKGPAAKKVLDGGDDLSAIFGIEIENDVAPPASSSVAKDVTKDVRRDVTKNVAKRMATETAKKAVVVQAKAPRLSERARRAVSKRMKAYWAERRAPQRRRKSQ
jgi:uncharacterized Zn finger protein